MYRWTATNVRMPYRVSNTGEGESPNIIGTQCTIHQQPLMMKAVPEEFNNVFAAVIKAVNFIIASVLYSRLFYELAKEMSLILKQFCYILTLGDSQRAKF